MKNYMPLNGLRWSRDSGSANCDMLQSDVLGRPGGGACSLGVLCTDFYLLVKIFGREGLLYGFIVVTLLGNNMALVGPINYYL